MEQIIQLLEELIDVTDGYQKDEIDQVEFHLKLQLLISKIDKIEINTAIYPFKKLVTRRHTKFFNQLLYKSKYKAIQALLKMRETSNKQLVQQRLQIILINKLYFHSLYEKLMNNCEVYMREYPLSYSLENMQVFILNNEVSSKESSINDSTLLK
ncbi:hypothetical protein [Aquibacillus albus]|uniref:Septum formation topological specificity factor MinE n=1 Tax=Aquibacillus albus TaxID=1168171 RepID=A0ABS2MY98_9BACI|nr:hypothetical protein [Aquibacillus albus]MBM7570868.1 septum formation topological specificity factor MinE [Aquibacillus albus]